MSDDEIRMGIGWCSIAGGVLAGVIVVIMKACYDRFDGWKTKKNTVRSLREYIENIQADVKRTEAATWTLGSTSVREFPKAMRQFNLLTKKLDVLSYRIAVYSSIIGREETVEITRIVEDWKAYLSEISPGIFEDKAFLNPYTYEYFIDLLGELEWLYGKRKSSI